MSSSKDIYESGRFLAGRYAAGRYRGASLIIPQITPGSGWDFDTADTVFEMNHSDTVFVFQTVDTTFRF